MSTSSVGISRSILFFCKQKDINRENIKLLCLICSFLKFLPFFETSCLAALTHRSPMFHFYIPGKPFVGVQKWNIGLKRFKCSEFKSEKRIVIVGELQLIAAVFPLLKQQSTFLQIYGKPNMTRYSRMDQVKFVEDNL